MPSRFRPPPPFDASIQYLWYAEGQPQVYRRQSVLPSGVAVLVINVAEDRLRIYTGPGYAECRALPGTPKRYLRIARFQRVLRRIHGSAHVDWSDVAYRCGYSDQSHFIREFKEFSGLTPSQYRQRATAGRNHAALDD